MQWSLFLLILMGQCFVSTCQLYEYHYIRDKKTWAAAQNYCRQHYTDLASVFDMADMTGLQESTEHKGEAWIGLFNKTGGDNRMWHWSLPGVKYSEGSEPDNQNGPKNCVTSRDKWAADTCDQTWWFICYDEKKKDGRTIYLVENKFNWRQAQNYCREHYTDLASGLDQVEGEEFKKLNYSQGSPFSVWIGLFRDSWRWSDGSNFSFRYWDMELFNDAQNNKTCAVTLLDRSGKWSSDDCNKEKPFFCYDDKLVLINEDKTWEEALDYCRKNYRDLVSITNPDQQRVVEVKAVEASSLYVWLGLRYSCTLDLWFWVSDNRVYYDQWAAGGKTEECEGSAAMDRGGQHEWFSQRDNERYNFICSTQ